MQKLLLSSRVSVSSGAKVWRGIPLFVSLMLFALPVGAASIADIGKQIPNGKLLWSKNNKIYFSTLGNWNPKAVQEGYRPRWSPSGDRILYGNGANLYVMNSDFTGAKEVIKGIGAEFWESGYGWTPDGKGATVLMADQRTIRQVDIASGMSSVIYFDTEQDLVEAAHLRPVTGRYLLMFRVKPFHIRIWDVQEQKALDTTNLGANCTPAWSPDGSYITSTQSASKRPITKAMFNPSDAKVPSASFLVGIEKISPSGAGEYCHFSLVSNDGKWVVFSGTLDWDQYEYDSYIWKIGTPQEDVVKFTTGGGQQPDLFIPPTLPPDAGPPPAPDAGVPPEADGAAAPLLPLDGGGGPDPAPDAAIVDVSAAAANPDTGAASSLGDTSGAGGNRLAGPSLSGGCQLAPTSAATVLLVPLLLAILVAARRVRRRRPRRGRARR